MRVLGNIHLVKIDYVNVYVIERDNELLLIDAGLSNATEHVLPYINSLGYDPKDLSLIIITHKHSDHVGGLKELLEASGAKVAASRYEVDGIKERTSINKIDVLLNDGDIIKGLRVIHTPGHTPGHIALLEENTKALFVGDLMRVENGKLLEIPEKYSEDPEANREAIKKLVNIDFSHILPAHGEPILNRGKEALLELIKTF